MKPPRGQTVGQLTRLSLLALIRLVLLLHLALATLLTQLKVELVRIQLLLAITVSVQCCGPQHNINATKQQQ